MLCLALLFHIRTFCRFFRERKFDELESKLKNDFQQKLTSEMNEMKQQFAHQQSQKLSQLEAVLNQIKPT
jgi:ABC-type transport system involved in cytochrome bd biosynthesis fused ATPase/permease subunit